MLIYFYIKYFNSIKVRLEQNSSTEGMPRELHFNSIKVRLERTKFLKSLLFKEYFNSIKVRLELSIKAIRPMSVSFQFHKGTIRTDSDFVSQVLAHLFQFHKGTIRTNHLDADILILCEFQFHKGTIRTKHPIKFPRRQPISIP